MADLGVLSVVKRVAPEVDVHFSTQAGIANYLAANAAYDPVSYTHLDVYKRQVC